MPGRIKGRAKFDFCGRAFVWWVDGDRYLRISSLDKKFAVAFPLLRATDTPAVIEVVGQEFPGIDRAESRPIWLVVPEPPSDSMGACVEGLLRWSFDLTHTLVRFDGPVCF